MTTPEIAQYALGILASGAVGAVIVGLFNKGKVSAEAQETAAETYRKLNVKLTQDADRITASFDRQIKDIVTGYELKLKQKDVIIAQQTIIIDEQKGLIEAQNDRIGVLEGKVDDLEKLVETSKQLPKVVEEAREMAHHTIDVVADTLNPEIETEK